MDSLGRKAIDAARNVAVALVGVVEARDIECAVSTHVKRFLVIDVICYGHHAVEPAFTETADIVRKFFLAENGVDRGEAERRVGEKGRQFEETVHAARRGFHHEANVFCPTRLTQVFEVRRRFGVQVIYNNVYLLGAVVAENANEAVYEFFAAHFH